MPPAALPPRVQTADEAAAVPDDVPQGTPIEQLDRWIKQLERAAHKAEAVGNLAALASIAQKVTALTALRHRITPLPKADPNDRPDYAELAKVGEERLATLIKGTFKEHGGFPDTRMPRAALPT